MRRTTAPRRPILAAVQRRARSVALLRRGRRSTQRSTLAPPAGAAYTPRSRGTRTPPSRAAHDQERCRIGPSRRTDNARPALEHVDGSHRRPAATPRRPLAAIMANRHAKCSLHRRANRCRALCVGLSGGSRRARRACGDRMASGSLETGSAGPTRLRSAVGRIGRSDVCVVSAGSSSVRSRSGPALAAMLRSRSADRRRR